MSQICHLGLSFNFMKSRKIIMQKEKKSKEIKTRAYIKILRHGSLPENYKYVPLIVSKISWIKK